MFVRLLAAFIFIPLIELFLLLKLAEATSAWTTFVVVIVTGILGSMLAKREGSQAWHRLRLAMAEGRMPGREIQEGMLIAFAAALLLTPGLLTDAFGFALLIPPSRELFRRLIVQRYKHRFQVHVQTHQTSPTSNSRSSDGYTIDATSVESRATNPSDES